MAKNNKVFVFFNCDENKNESSMNIFYNHAVYKDTKASRKNLWKRIKEENLADRIQISQENIVEVETIIMDGDPTFASEYMKFGAIKSLDCF
ncbi:MAG: hypothetical protein IKZ58_00725 [Selenomonadaceae bacterium]|nr:hypothetical protein [Selenomonadaceae bacterium]